MDGQASGVAAPALVYSGRGGSGGWRVAAVEAAAGSPAQAINPIA